MYLGNAFDRYYTLLLVVLFGWLILVCGLGLVGFGFWVDGWWGCLGLGGVWVCCLGLGFGLVICGLLFCRFCFLVLRFG